MVVTLMGILAAMAIPSASPGVVDKLESAGRVLAADLDFARSLAITNNSQYRVTIELANNRYVLEHSGASAALDVLPAHILPDIADTPDRHVTSLNDFPGMDGVKLAAVRTTAGNLPGLLDVEFGPLGGTTRSEDTIIWLAAGNGIARRFISVEINFVTGLARVGDVIARDFTTPAPAEAAAIEP